MAEPNPNRLPWSPLGMANPPGNPGPDVRAAPGYYPPLSDFPLGYECPPYPQHHDPISQYNRYEGYQGFTSPFHYHHPQHPNPQYPQQRQWPPPAGPRADAYAYSPPPLPFGYSRNLQSMGNMQSDISGTGNNDEMPPMIEPGSTTTPYARSHDYGNPQTHIYPMMGRRFGQMSPYSPATPSNRESLPIPIPGRGAAGTGNGNVPAQPSELAFPIRRTPYERQNQERTANTAERRSLIPNNRRSDRSVSPRTSNRRSFDRYSIDAPTPPDTEASRARAIQRRRVNDQARIMRARHGNPYMDGGCPSAHQMKALNDKLRHLLPNQLPEGSSADCDICQKAYSAKNCDPTEDNEMAIQLPCKHIFGEHCINTWFETCKKHKNKITCPMCRKLLVDPPVRRFSRDMDSMLALLSRPGASGLGIAEQQALSQLMAAQVRDLEGDFL